MKDLLLVLQIVISILLIVAIISQVRGGGFARSWGGGGSSFTRRGLEKLVFKMTFVLAVLFILVSILQLVV